MCMIECVCDRECGVCVCVIVCGVCVAGSLHALVNILRETVYKSSGGQIHHSTRQAMYF